MSDIYNGSSESFDFTVDGYLDYAKAVLIRRAFPDVRDGLKPGARRIVYSTYKSNILRLTKSSSIVGRAMELHPHGNDSIYGTMADMTDKNGSYNVPLYRGRGDLGHNFSSNAPAAFRYTEACLLESTVRDMLEDIDYIPMMEAEEGEGTEPTVLPAKFPIVLVNGTKGIGVGVSANIPSFNLGDVIDLTVKYLETGELTVDDLIVPDFPTGGVLVRNDEEIMKIMLTGKGKLRVRAKVELCGKEIKVLEVPAGKTSEAIASMISKANIKEIDNVTIAYGRDSDSLVLIECKTKKCVEYVLMELYRRNILQTSYNSSMLLVNGDKPLVCGVYDVIKIWCQWNADLQKRKYADYIASTKAEIKRLSYMVRLTSNEEWRDTYVNKVLKEPKKVSEDYLVELFPDIPDEVVQWIYGRQLTSFKRAGKYADRYNSLQETLSTYEEIYENPAIQMIKELKEIKALRKAECVRKTELTYRDYKFSKAVEADVVDTSFCVYTLRTDGFLMKTRDALDRDDILCTIYGDASSTLVGFDNFGRVLRIAGQDIPFTPYDGDGVYLPSYFEASFQNDYRVMYMCLLDGKRRMIIYKDGYVGFFDTSEWVGKKVIKVVSQGVDLHVYDMIVDIVEEGDVNANTYLLVADYDRKKRCRMSVAKLDTIPVRSRKSRAKVFQGSDINISHYALFDLFGGLKFLDNFDWYRDKMRVVKEDDLIGDIDLVEEGRYTNWGYDEE